MQTAGAPTKRQMQRQVTQRRAEYRKVAQQSEEKPIRCPDCGDCNVPSHRMYGRLDKDTGDVVWSCVACRARERELRAQGLTTCYCDWCCAPFTASKERRFCGKPCEWTWQRAAANRSAGDPDDAPART